LLNASFTDYLQFVASPQFSRNATETYKNAQF